MRGIGRGGLLFGKVVRALPTIREARAREPNLVVVKVRDRGVPRRSSTRALTLRLARRDADRLRSTRRLERIPIHVHASALAFRLAETVALGLHFAATRPEHRGSGERTRRERSADTLPARRQDDPSRIRDDRRRRAILRGSHGGIVPWLVGYAVMVRRFRREIVEKGSQAHRQETRAPRPVAFVSCRPLLVPSRLPDAVKTRSSFRVRFAPKRAPCGTAPSAPERPGRLFAERASAPPRFRAPDTRQFRAHKKTFG